MSEQITLDGLKNGDVLKVDMLQFLGSNSKIQKVEVKEGKYGHYLLVSALPVKDEKTEMEITPTKILNLSIDKDEKVCWDKNGKTQDYLNSINVEHPKELVGKDIKIKTTDMDKNGNVYLTF